MVLLLPVRDHPLERGAGLRHFGQPPASRLRSDRFPGCGRASIIWRSTSLGSPTIGTSAATLEPTRRGSLSTWTCVASAPQVGGWPKCSPLQKRNPKLMTTSARPVNGFFHAPRTASGWSSATAPCPARRVVDRRGRQLRQLPQLGPGVRPEHPVAADQQRPLGAEQELDGPFDRTRIPLGAQLVGAVDAGPGTLLGLVTGAVEDILGNLDHGHALRRAGGGTESLAQVELDRAPIQHASGVLGEACGKRRSRRASWNESRPSSIVGCWPDRHTTALLVSAATASPVMALVSPHPAVTQQTPGVPGVRAHPSAA